MAGQSQSPDRGGLDRRHLCIFSTTLHRRVISGGRTCLDCDHGCYKHDRRWPDVSQICLSQPWNSHQDTDRDHLASERQQSNGLEYLIESTPKGAFPVIHSVMVPSEKGRE